MPTRKSPSKQPGVDLTPADVRAWLAELAAGDHASSATIQSLSPVGSDRAKTKEVLRRQASRKAARRGSAGAA